MNFISITKSHFKSLLSVLAIAGLVFFSSCGDDDNGPSISFTGETTIYTLVGVGGSASLGTATFAEQTDGSTVVTVDVTSTVAATTLPMHIHDNTAAEGGGIAITLNAVDGTTGSSETTVTMKDDETAITYDELIAYDGYINVHLSATDLATLVVQGDIGQNALTGESETYTLSEVDVDGVSGTATFEERVNGETLVTVELMNTTSGDSHPMHIHDNTAAEGGGIAITLSSVDGATGLSKTNVSVNDALASVSYSALIDYDGYINIHNSAADLGTLVAQGDIGQNELTGTSEVYTLNEVDVAGVSGTAEFAERVNGETLVIVTLANTASGDSHPMHIHDNTAALGGGIAITLTSVDGTSGVSKTNVAAKDDMSAITYTAMADYNGYINVHQSAEDLATLVAQGDIGANVQ